MRSLAMSMLSAASAGDHEQWNGGDTGDGKHYEEEPADRICQWPVAILSHVGLIVCDEHHRQKGEGQRGDGKDHRDDSDLDWVDAAEQNHNGGEDGEAIGDGEGGHVSGLLGCAP